MNITIHQYTKTPNESVERLLAELGQEQTTLHYGKAVDKLEQYQYFLENNIPHPEWTQDHKKVVNWLSLGEKVVARRFTKSNKGVGIDILETLPESLEEYKVFTLYKKKKREFRVNLFQHVVVNVREKLKKGDGSSFIRNVANGWTTTHLVSDVPEGLEELATRASKVSASDFIGVDVGWNASTNKLFVFEVNSGPSIEGSSVKDFANTIKKAYNV
jgi:hypothetical protein